MAKLRLFANLREMAGSARLEVDGDTVGGVIATVAERYGPDFERGLQTSRVWVNGQEATMDMALSEADEIVLLPPVSGGNQPSAISGVDLIGFLPVVVALLAVVANLQSQEIWAATLVAIAAAWALDLAAAFRNRGRSFMPLAAATSAAGAVLAAHSLGGSGYALALPIAVMVTLGWAVAFPVYRSMETVAPTLLVSVIAALGTASLMVLRSSSSVAPAAVDVFLASVIAGAVVGAVVARMPPLPLLDPYTSTAITSVLASVVAAGLWDLDLVNYLLFGLGIAVALVAGFGLSSILRLGRSALTERSPGVLVPLDGFALAAAILYPLVSLIF